MNETIDYALVYAKTPKGVAEISVRSGAISMQTRRVLIMIDGRRPVAELMAVVRTGEFDGIIATLEAQGMIDKVDPASLPPRPLAEEDFVDTISLLEENATALRSVPYINPASLVPPAHPAPAARPATISVTPPIAGTAPADSATIAAQAVAAASAPRAAEPPVRRPPTLNGAGSANLVDNVNAVRLGTMSGTARVPDPATRPPTLTGQRAAVPAARPVTEASVRANAASAAPARAEPVPAAPASAAPAPRPLEEEKRHAVSELYSVLGPYGEQPAARIQECTSVESLHEQIRQAGRRIATFRGERAAQEYLRAIGHA